MKIYYAINVSVLSNGNFKFQDREYKINEDYDKIFYFHTRKNAVDSARRSYDSLSKTIVALSGTTEMIDMLEEFKPWFCKVCNKVPMFDICIQMNDSEIEYKLGKVKVFEKSDNMDILFENLSTNPFRLNILKNWKTDYNWYSIDKVPDAIE